MESLLSLDGGGIRGLVLAELLLALESITKRPIYDLFDWSSGTSTGSYLAVSVANRKLLYSKSYLNAFNPVELIIKLYRLSGEQRCIQNPVKHLR